MHTREVTSDKGNKYILPVVSEDEMQEIMFGMSDNGWCIACGEEAYGVEPDARKYECECCEKRAVYGYQELLMMGLLTIK
jgi:hypothetical protein